MNITNSIDSELKVKEWNVAYSRGANVLFYPHEEIIRFMSKYIKKKIGLNEYKVIRNYKKALDIGCGIGRHVKYLSENGFEAHGVDLSQWAIDYGKKWLTSIGMKESAARMTCCSAAQLPYDSGFFDFIVSHSTFDCMNFQLAQECMHEAHRVLKNGAFL